MRKKFIWMGIWFSGISFFLGDKYLEQKNQLFGLSTCSWLDR
jgi:hypothetical protein